MSTTASFYVEYATPAAANTDRDGADNSALTWTYDPDGFGRAGCSGWSALLGLVPAVSAQGRRFPGIATRGFPDDMDEATITALLKDSHLADNSVDSDGSGWTSGMPRLSRDKNTSLAWFTLADLNAVIASDADFVTDRRDYTKFETIESAHEVIDRAEARATFEKFPAEHVRFIVALD